MVVHIFSEITTTGKKRKTNMGKQGKPQENRGKPRKTGETCMVKQRKNKENQGKI